MATGPELDAVIVNPLKASGLVDGAQIERARTYAREHATLLSDALLKLSLLREADYLRVFAELYSTKLLKSDKLRTVEPEPSVVARVPVRLAERLRACPLSFDQERKEVAVVAAVPLSSALEAELRKATGARLVSVHIATNAAVAALIRKAYYEKPDAFRDVTFNGAGPSLPNMQWSATGDTVDDERLDTTPDRTRVSRDASFREPAFSTEREPTGTDQTMIRDLTGNTQPRPGAIPQVTATGRVPLTTVVVPDDELGPLPPPSVTDGKTVMVKLEDLTIATLRRENARYRIAQEFHRRVSLERDVDALIDRILSVVFELLNADGAAMWLTSGRYSSKTRDGGAQIEVPRTVIDQALVSSGGILTSNALIDERFDRSKSVMVRGIRSVMAVPLRTRNGTIGVLYVESTSMTSAFTEEELPIFDAVAAQAALLLDNASLVAQVQREVETRASLSRFLSQAAVDEVLSGRTKVNMSGQSAEITVLFADIRGFTTMSAHMPPEEVVRFLNAFFGEAVDAVEKNGGIVDKFIGDCVMAIWGAIETRDDDPRRCISAALEMVQRARKIMVNGERLDVGVGINTGPAVVGAIGAQRRLDYTAIGATVNLAARLCGIAGSGEVLITSDTLLRAGPGVVNTAHEAVALKGIDVPIVPYVVKTLALPLRLDQMMKPAK